MSNSNVLEIVRQAYSELGLYPYPQTAVGSSQALPQQITALYAAVGQMLVARRTWRGLLRQFSFTTPTPATLVLLPSDYARPVNQTEWDTVNHWPLMGPMTPQQMQTLQSGIISNGPRIKFRLVGNNIELFPASAANQTFVLNYISKGWIVSDTGQGVNYVSKPVSDTDVAIFDDRLMVNGIKLRFNQAKGFDTTSFAEDFQVSLDDALSQDSGAPKLTMAANPATFLVNVTNIPDGNWPA